MIRRQKTKMNNGEFPEVIVDYNGRLGLWELSNALNSHESTGFYMMEIRTYVCLLYFQNKEDAVYFKMRFG